MMLKTLEKSGKTEEAAIAAALEELGLDRDDVSVEIVERAKSGFLGIGASPAVVRVQYEAPDEEPETVAEAPAAAPTAQEQPAAAPAAPARPQQRKVSDDTLTSPFVEDLSGKMQQEIAQRQAAEASRQAAEAEAARQAAEAANPAAAANEKVGRMSLDELLNDIHNM